MKDANGKIETEDEIRTKDGDDVICRDGVGGGGGGGASVDGDKTVTIRTSEEVPDKTSTSKPTVTFDPNPTILLTTEDGSPAKIGGKDGGKKGEKTGGKGTNPTASGGNAQTGPPTKMPDEPTDYHLKDLYQQISTVVSSAPDEKEQINEDEAEDPAAVPMIWVSKWVDYSDKYGLGYQLCDDSIGVLFNDFSKLLLLADGENIHYIERNGTEHYHTLNEFPSTISKKVTLLRYFRNYMNEHLLKTAASMCPREGDELARIPSLRTYFRTRSAIILHLTNGTLQINFFEDHTKLILCPLMGAVTYIDEKRNFRTFRLSSLQQYGCRPELADRLRYARNIIQKLMVVKSGSSSSKTISSVSSGTATVAKPAA